MEFVALGFRFVLASVFVLAGLAKLPRRREFEAAVRGYELLPNRLVRPVAVGLAPLELSCGLFLAAGLATRYVAVALAVLLASFAAAIAVNLLRGREIDCGCLSVAAPKRIAWPAVARNLGLAATALAVATSTPQTLALDQFLQPPASTLPTDQAIAVLITSTLLLGALVLVSNVRQLHAHITPFDGTEGRRAP